MAISVHIKRVYTNPAADDGFRVLVDRLWPRGVTKEAATVDAWIKDIAPSQALRQWFNHEPTKFEEFSERYRAELAERHEEIQELLGKTDGKRLTLVYAAADEEHNHAIVLASYLREIA